MGFSEGSISFTPPVMKDLQPHSQMYSFTYHSTQPHSPDIFCIGIISHNISLNLHIHIEKSSQQKLQMQRQDLTGLHKYFTSTQLNTCGMNWNARCPDLNPTGTPMQARDMLREKYPNNYVPISCGKHSQNKKKRNLFHINTFGFGMRRWTGRYPNTFDHIM